MLQLCSIILAILVGYISNLPVKPAVLNKTLSALVLLILLVMGYDFGSKAANLVAESLQVGKIVATFTLFLLVFNFMAAYAFAKLSNKNPANARNKQESHHWFSYILESSKYFCLVIAGIMLGYLIRIQIVYLNAVVSILLFLSLFIIGHQLKVQGISLRKIVANRSGVMLSVIIVGSSMLAGAACTYLLNLRLHEGLMMASGYGWYTLSGILSGQLINHQIGAASFFIDFFREIIAIILIPLFGRMYPLPFIAYSGATALDFALPAIKIHMGDEAVPIAITSGMILTILVPLMLPALCWICA